MNEKKVMEIELDGKINNARQCTRTKNSYTRKGNAFTRNTRTYLHMDLQRYASCIRDS